MIRLVIGVSGGKERGLLKKGGTRDNLDAIPQLMANSSSCHFLLNLSVKRIVLLIQRPVGWL